MKAHLIICEKPSVAEDIVAALFPGAQRHRDYWESPEAWVFWCHGHLLELAPPEQQNPQWKDWKWENLPMLPNEFKYVPKSKQAEARLAILSPLLAQAKEVVNACDAGREGEYIFELVTQYCGWQRATKYGTRLWLNSTTPNAIRAAWAARSSEPLNKAKYIGLAEAARMRDQADWLLGLNATQAATLGLPTGKDGGVEIRTWTVGRVQTALLGILVDLDEKVKNYQERPYYSIYVTFSGREGMYQGRMLVPAHLKALGHYTMIFADEEEANLTTSILKSHSHLPWRVADKTTVEKWNPPGFFDLEDLQATCNVLYGWSADETLQLAQEAYEQKLITYPRTSVKALPLAMEAEAEAILAQLWTNHAQKAFKVLQKTSAPSFAALSHKKKLFDDTKLSDHHGIIPTGNIPADALTLKRSKVTNLWEVVVKRFYIAASLAAEVDVVERRHDMDATSTVDELKPYPFRTPIALTAESRFEFTREWGWIRLSEVFQQDTPQKNFREDALPTTTEATVVANKIEVYTGYTTAPEFYTEGRLISRMKRENLGTSATRAAAIESLVHRGYIERLPSRIPTLRPTAQGRVLINELRKRKLEYLTLPNMTGAWELLLEQVEKGVTGAPSREDFLNLIVERVHEIKAALHGEAGVLRLPVLCPKTRLPVDEVPGGFKFAGYPNMEFPAELFGLQMTSAMYRDILLSPKGAGPYEFFSPKTGKFFRAKVTVEGNKFKLKFK